MPSTSIFGRLLAPRPLAVVALAAVLAGCASSRPDGWTDDARKAPADTTDSPARVGLAATMEIPENPYGDTAAVEVPAAEDIASGAVPLGVVVDPDDITVGRYYYGDEGTTYYEDVADDLADDGQGWDDDVYYGGYDAAYYHYADPAFFPSPYRYYRPYATYRPYVTFGWYPTWHHRRYWARPYYAGYGTYYDPYFDPYAYAYYGHGYYDPFFGPGLYVSVGVGYGYGHGGHYASAGYYGPGYYGRPRHRGYYDGFRGDDDGTRSRVRGLPGSRTSPIAQSQPDPSRQPARRGLAPARLPRPSTDRGITRSTGRRTAPDRAERPDRALPVRSPDRADRPVRSGGRTTPTADPGRSTGRTGAAPTRRAAPTRATPPSRTDPRQGATPRRAEPRRDTPPRRAEPRRDAPRRDTSPAPAPRRDTRPDPAPRRDTRPAPAPRRDTRPAPAPRRETSRPARSRSGDNRSSGSRSRRGDNE